MAARDFCAPMNPLLEWSHPQTESADSHWVLDKARKRILDFVMSSDDELAEAVASEPTAERFYRLADDWTRRTIHVSSASDLINDKRYREIIGMGWEVVPYLLRDLEQKKRFWFPALAEITGVRPFDSSDRNNPRRMTQAWIRWGKWKGLI